MTKLKVEKTNKNTKKFLSVCVFIMLSGLILSKIQISGMGAEVASLEKDEKSIREDIKEYSSKMMNNSSLTQNQKQVEEMGFKKTTNLIYLHESDSFAQLP